MLLFIQRRRAKIEERNRRKIHRLTTHKQRNVCQECSYKLGDLVGDSNSLCLNLKEKPTILNKFT